MLEQPENGRNAGQEELDELSTTVGCSTHAASGTRFAPAERAEYERWVSAVRTQLGEATWAVAAAEGQAMTEEQATAYALREDA